MSLKSSLSLMSARWLSVAFTALGLILHVGREESAPFFSRFWERICSKIGSPGVKRTSNPIPGAEAGGREVPMMQRSQVSLPKAGTQSASSERRTFPRGSQERESRKRCETIAKVIATAIRSQTPGGVGVGSSPLVGPKEKQCLAGTLVADARGAARRLPSAATPCLCAGLA